MKNAINYIEKTLLGNYFNSLWNILHKFCLFCDQLSDVQPKIDFSFLNILSYKTTEIEKIIKLNSWLILINITIYEKRHNHLIILMK